MNKTKESLLKGPLLSAEQDLLPAVAKVGEQQMKAAFAPKNNESPSGAAVNSKTENNVTSSPGFANATQHNTANAAQPQEIVSPYLSVPKNTTSSFVMNSTTSNEINTPSSKTELPGMTPPQNQEPAPMNSTLPSPEVSNPASLTTQPPPKEPSSSDKSNSQESLLVTLPKGMEFVYSNYLRKVNCIIVN